MRLQLIGLVIFGVAWIVASSCAGGRRTPDLLEIPAGYRGYLVVQFQDASCPALPRRNQYQVIRFGDDGRACASESYAEQEGIANDRYVYVFPDGHSEDLPIRDDVSFGRMYAGSLHRMVGWVYAPPGGDSSVNYVIEHCAWSDNACWKPLRLSAPGTP
jgi:hypothetical protein